MSNDTTPILRSTESLCPVCLERIPAFYVQHSDGVYFMKECHEHGSFETPVWLGNVPFTSWVRCKTPASIEHPFHEIERGCPFDCGLCPAHRQHTCTALIEVTQRCNMNCAYCFASSRAGWGTDLSLETIRSMYQCLLDAGGPYNVQLSGGEPSMRDDLPEIIALGHSMGFDFIQLNTNGLRIAEDFAYLERLKEAGLSSVFLQFDGTSDEIHRLTRGRNLSAQKTAAVQNCAALNIGVVLVPTLVPGVNHQDIGNIIRFGIQHIPAVRGVHFQPVSYFGRYPVEAKLPRITIPEIMQNIETQTGGVVRVESFRPSGCENALCSFHGNYVLMADGQLKALTKKRTGCCSPPEDAALGAAKNRQFVALKWSAPVSSTGEKGGSYQLGAWEELAERAHTHAFSISGMAFQDAWTLDLERLRDCCIHIVSPQRQMVPFCAYNLTALDGRTLYRPMVEERTET